MPTARASRDEWRKRIEQWKESGQTAEEFGAAHGLRPGTLIWWRSALAREARVAQQATPVAKRADGKLPTIVELRAPATEVRFEVVVDGRTRVLVPARFEADAFKRLLSVLRSTS